MKRLLHIQFLLVLLLALGYSSLQAKRITQWQAQQQYLTTMQADSSLSLVMMP